MQNAVDTSVPNIPNLEIVIVLEMSCALLKSVLIPSKLNSSHNIQSTMKTICKELALQLHNSTFYVSYVATVQVNCIYQLYILKRNIKYRNGISINPALTLAGFVFLVT